MNGHKAYVDYQQRATEFAVGDVVYPFFGSPDQAGRVTAVWPAIGMVDVEWPHGPGRMPVEDLAQYEAKDYRPPHPVHENVPGGVSTVQVPGGPMDFADPLPGQKVATFAIEGSIRRVAEAFVKKALYWGAADRKYRATKSELDTGAFNCPKCRKAALRKAIYKRSEGRSEDLLGCPDCMFLIKRCDIIGSDEWRDLNEPVLEVA